MTELSILLVCGEPLERVDGIRDYAEQMASQLRADGDLAAARLVARGLRAPFRLLRGLPRDRPVALVIQYNPFSWGRWGVAPGLLALMAAARLLRPRTALVLMVHEGYVPMRNLRWVLMGGWQRAQLRILLLCAHRALVTTADLATTLSELRPRRQVTHLPVGSNLPDERAARSAERARAGYDNRLVLASFHTGHESHLSGHVAATVAALSRESAAPVVLLTLGDHGLCSPEKAAATPVRDEGAAETVSPGYLPADDLARQLAGADLFLAPFADGATTRRTTLIAAMQHGLAIVTTVSDHTEPALRAGDVLGLAPPNDVPGFVAEAIRTALDPELQRRRGAAARQRYEDVFAWPVLAAQLRAAVIDAVARTGTIAA